MGVDNYIYIFALHREYWKTKKIWKLAAYNLFNVSDCIYRNQNYTTWVFKIYTTINIQKFNSKLRLHKCLNHQIYLNSKACWLCRDELYICCNFIIFKCLNRCVGCCWLRMHVCGQEKLLNESMTEWLWFQLWKFYSASPGHHSFVGLGYARTLHHFKWNKNELFRGYNFILLRLIV